jgi:hypothetical protein
VSEAVDRSSDSAAEPPAVRPEDVGHPRGTLVIVLLYALLFALTWLGLYVYEFLERGAPRP